MTSPLRLRAYRPSDAPLVVSWSTSPEDTRHWCGSSQHPTSTAQIDAWHTPDVRPYVLKAEASPVAYGELWLDDAEDEVELARLIVAPSRRNLGLGRRLVEELVLRAAETRYPMAYMRVHADNAAALRCYATAGFARVSGAENAAFNRGQPHSYTWLRRALRG